MGFLRFFLAFCVVNVHGHVLGTNLFPADAAVQSFYVISGFYMAMVLNEKYNRPGMTYYDFFLSRVFRIAPAYFLILFMTIIVGLVAWFGFGALIAPFVGWKLLFNQISGPTLFALTSPQLLLFGLDFVHFFTLNQLSELVFTQNFSQEPVQLWRSLAVPQAWSLAIELYFYCLAPFLVRRSPRLLLFLIVCSFGIRLALAMLFANRFDPWSYRFFPSELMYFLCGSLAYQLSKTSDPLGNNWNAFILRGVSFLIIVAAGMIGRYGLDGRTLFFSPIIIGIIFLTLPKLFFLTKNIRSDKYIGELSYPLYISHMLVIWTADLFLVHGSLQQRTVVCLGSLFFAVLIYEFLDRKVDDIRHRLFAHDK
jgi:peptidoglycan/LPS O-acetylase OafA/YrhL